MPLRFRVAGMSLARQHTKELQSSHTQQDPAKQTAAAAAAHTHTAAEVSSALLKYTRPQLMFTV
jgi:hypothetical protein